MKELKCAKGRVSGIAVVAVTKLLRDGIAVCKLVIIPELATDVASSRERVPRVVNRDRSSEVREKSILAVSSASAVILAIACVIMLSLMGGVSRYNRPRVGILAKPTKSVESKPGS